MGWRDEGSGRFKRKEKKPQETSPSHLFVLSLDSRGLVSFMPPSFFLIDQTLNIQIVEWGYAALSPLRHFLIPRALFDCSAAKWTNQRLRLLRASDIGIKSSRLSPLLTKCWLKAGVHLLKCKMFLHVLRGGLFCYLKGLSGLSDWSSRGLRWDLLQWVSLWADSISLWSD